MFPGIGFFPTDELPTINPPSWHGLVHAVLVHLFLGRIARDFSAAPPVAKTALVLVILAALNVTFFFIFYGGLEHLIGLYAGLKSA